MTEQQTETRIVKVGDVVKAVTSKYEEVKALVTAVHGVGYNDGTRFHQPCINVVYVSPDASKSDSFGRQIERDLTSLQHFEEGPNNMPKPGRYYELIELS